MKRPDASLAVLCKQHSTKTTDKRSLQARKGKDEEGNVVTDRQHDTMRIYTRDSPIPRAGKSQGDTTIIAAPKTPIRLPPPPERSSPSSQRTFHPPQRQRGCPS